ncbi:uncharacterized protein LOC111638035 [Centruroides sculpturatus]|uniref:uncharacterized protein LOC111638035 n=1 Tax=Centruroides sculpturatus TaxID=218467 RepID=UPI000C6DA0E2|nr:uncharacterized protein LOC111638035 [Centruroides sculpturatus]
MTATNPEKDELDLEAVGRFPMTSRIFAINGVFPTLRACLLKRGWIEKKHRFHFCTKTEPYMWPFTYDLVRKSESKGINKNQNANKRYPNRILNIWEKEIDNKKTVSKNKDTRRKKLNTIGETQWWAKDVVLKKVFSNFANPKDGLYVELILTLQYFATSINIQPNIRIKAKSFLDTGKRRRTSHVHVYTFKTCASTSLVTRLLCANVIDDTLKIVLDRRVNNKCSIGHFELGYQGDVLPWTEFSDRTLVLTGKKIEKPIRNSTKLSVSSNLMTNKSTVKEGKSKFEEEVYCAKLILWCASNLYRNIQNYKFKNSYVDKIVNDIKNCEKYNYYSVCNGSIPAKTHYIVPQHFGNSKNKNKSFTIFEKANIRIVMTENV